MNLTIKIGIVIYIIIIVQVMILSTILLIKSKKNAKLFSLLSINACAVCWMFFAIIEKLAAGSDGYLFFIRFPLIFIHLLTASGLVFSIYYLDILGKIKNKIAILIFIPFIISFLPYLTKDYFYLIVKKCIDNSVVVEWGPVLWSSKILSYFYLLVAVLLIAYNLIRFKKEILPNILLIFCFLTPMIVHFLMEFKVFNPNGFDFTPVTFSIVITFYTILSFKYRVVDMKSKAYLDLFEITNSAVLLFDKDNFIEDYNASFASLFKLDYCKSKNKINDFLNDIEMNILDVDEFIKFKKDLFEKADHVRSELALRNIDNNSRHFLIDSLIINNKRKEYLGKMLLFRDITEYKELVLFDERLKLSNNIHDSLGNSLNVIKSNLEYVINLYKTQYKKENSILFEQIGECLDISYRKTSEAFIDLRRIVNGLSPIDIENNGFVWAINSIINKIKSKDTHIDFYCDIKDEKVINKEIGIEVYHICEEALNNSLTHGRPKNININILQKDTFILLYIIDDGHGCKKIIENKGLKGMGIRVSKFGGSLKYGSPSEGGFNIKIKIPL